MDTRSIYPECRRYIDSHTVDDVVERIDELLAYGEPVAITDTGHNPWVLVPAALYDTMVAVWAGFNADMERRRQAVEPLPPL